MSISSTLFGRSTAPSNKAEFFVQGFPKATEKVDTALSLPFSCNVFDRSPHPGRQQPLSLRVTPQRRRHPRRTGDGVDVGRA